MTTTIAHRHDAHDAPAAHHHHGKEHRHNHAAAAGERRLLAALAILVSFTVVEAVGGYLANSIALLAEALHMLTDAAALILSIVAIRMSRRPADPQRTYGHRRHQPLAAFVNGQVLLLLTAGVVYEALRRLMHGSAVSGPLMLGVALIGGIANMAAFFALSGAQSLNERSARAHVLSDLLGSFMASVAAILILLRGWVIADPLLSLLVSVLIFRSAWSLVRESADVLLESVPSGFDMTSVEKELMGNVPGLQGVHHVHVWTMTGERPTVTLHVNVAQGVRHSEALSAIRLRLSERLNVEHVTIQIEEDGPCDTPDCT
ncbi:MAG TPA: cation diffusion facilitator family transporter [Steroidobacteraceae bacterium]|jgi:cobalt-zinc-cadmium efflux system protein|nr:cation diffusion facilitator family transporter [Steroidobacteraceae bacterium]